MAKACLVLTGLLTCSLTLAKSLGLSFLMVE